MGCYRDSRMSSSFGARSGCCGRMRWKPFEIAAMVLGFIVFWPIGLAILFAKFWQRQHGHQGDLFAFAREKAAGFRRTFYSQAGFGGESSAPSSWRSTGNVAFDEWRESELARLEAERRKPARPSAISPSISRSCAAPGTVRSSSPSCARERAGPRPDL